MPLNSKVFITGIDGFTGIYLEKYLKSKGYIVFGGSLKPLKSNHFIFDLNKIDTINNSLKEIKPDFVVHLAALSHSLSPKDEAFEINFKGSQNLLEILAKIKPKRTILASSATIYGSKSGLIKESDSPAPTSDYAKSKFMMEGLVKSCSLDVIITRAFNYIGRGQNENFVIPKIIAHFKKKEKYINLGNIKPKREYNDVSEVVRIFEKLLSKDLSYDIFNIGSGKSHSLSEIITMLIEITNHDIKVNIDPNLIRPDDPDDIKADTTRLIENNIKPCYNKIKDTLKEMLQ